MKTKTIVLVLILSLFLTNCVQKTVKRTVVFRLNTANMAEIKKVGIKGKDKPFNWDYATEMKTIQKDSLYELMTTFDTGYNYTEIKFMVNDSLEFENEDNRRVDFTASDTTFYNATFKKR
ncbi:hypothetical protein [Flavobacterium sp.]|uniref:hypothetical protein n=1 Tax=Flavobacterium sp. TaxID=239 RepID=UPI002615EF33|nr:hypothetical protein [Flavobacterium sp.]MDG2433823.1 hypothetical protein [Flavobacterium sp.]